ncbi:MAG: Ig-like domain-containing protein [Candidatus Scalindua sp.]|nr:Ig-like domain-containing protein [Candidatus Scalindua sp.]
MNDFLPLKKTRRFFLTADFFSLFPILTILLFLCNTGVVFADTTLFWDPPVDRTNVDGYKVYYGNSSRNYHASRNANKQTSMLLDFLAVDKTYYLSVVSYNSKGVESVYSNEVIYTNYVSGNSPPIAVDDLMMMAADTQVEINVIANDRDINGTVDPATVAVTKFPANGTAINNWDGTVTYIPDLGFQDNDSFSYTVEDTMGATSNEATVTVAISSSDAPEMTSPPPGSSLTTSTVTFQWSPISGADKYWLGVGTSFESVSTYPFGDIYGSSTGTNTTQQVTGIPINGNPVYVRLWWQIGSTWFTKDYTYEKQGGGNQAPAITGPAPGQTLTTSTVTFQWDVGAGVSRYWLGVGTSFPSVSAKPWGDIFASTTGTNRTQKVTGIPINGNPVHVRLWWKIGTAPWSYKDYIYQTQ